MQKVGLKMTYKKYREIAEDYETTGYYYAQEFEKYNGSFFPRCYLDYSDIKSCRENANNFISGAKVEKLECSNGRAFIVYSKGYKYLISYKTCVAVITPDGGFVKQWDGFSKTTLKHINGFLSLYGSFNLTKREWILLPLNEIIKR